MDKAFVVGIAGGSASGKTTFSNNLKRLLLSDLTVLELHMDSYFKPEESRSVAQSPVTGKAYRDDNHPSSFDLATLKRDLAEAVYGGQVQVVIVEGLLTLWDDELCEQADLRLFVECRADERIVRRLKRNMDWGLTFDQISDVYLDLVRYRHDEYVEPSKWHADLILNGSHPSDRAAILIADYIKSSV